MSSIPPSSPGVPRSRSFVTLPTACGVVWARSFFKGFKLWAPVLTVVHNGV